MKTAEPNIFEKVRFLLTREQKAKFLILSGLVFVGMLFEVAGLGMLIPILGFMLKDNIGERFPFLVPVLEFLGNPTQQQLVIGSMLFLVVFFLVKAIFMLALNWKQFSFTTNFYAEMSRKLFLGYLQQPYLFHLQRNSAQLLHYIQGEAGKLTSIVQAVIGASIEMAMIIGIVVTLLFVEPLGAVVVTTFLGVSAYGFYKFTRLKLLDWGTKSQIHAAMVNQHLLQGLNGVKDVKLMKKENFFVAKYKEHYSHVADSGIKNQTLQSLPKLYLEFIAIVGLASLTVVMILQGKSLNYLIATLGVFVAASFRVIPSINKIVGSFQVIRYSQPTINLLYGEFNRIRTSQLETDLKNKLKFARTIEISDLNFRYPAVSKHTLHNVRIRIKKGESVGFAGRSGSGKTTLVDVILGLLPPAAGEVTVDGINIQTNLRGWQEQIGYVPQSIYLIDDSLLANIAFGVDKSKINEIAVRQAVKDAQLEEFIAGLPDGINTLVGERGVRLSGGQRQRIGIARALYNNPDILVLDEATSALDNETEESVMSAIKSLHGQKTILIVAHRLSTIEHCDRIYRLEHGKIVSESNNTVNELRY